VAVQLEQHGHAGYERRAPLVVHGSAAIQNLDNALAEGWASSVTRASTIGAHAFRAAAGADHFDVLIAVLLCALGDRSMSTAQLASPI
jgi:hypothetical protein